MKKLFAIMLAFAFCFAACVQKPAETPKAATEFLPGMYPVTDVIKDETAVPTADALTPVLVRSLNAMDASALENPVFDKMYILIALGAHNPHTCYYDIFTPTDNATQFKISNINKLMYQLLGEEDFDGTTLIDRLPNGGYDQENRALVFSTDLGWGSLAAANAEGEIFSEFSSDQKQVITHFELWTHVPDEEACFLGDFVLIYDIVSENGENFLRVNRFEKV